MINSKLINYSKFFATSCHFLRETWWFVAILLNLIQKNDWLNLWYKAFWWRKIVFLKVFIFSYLWNWFSRLFSRLFKNSVKFEWFNDVAVTVYHSILIIFLRFFIFSCLWNQFAKLFSRLLRNKVRFEWFDEVAATVYHLTLIVFLRFFIFFVFKIDL